MMSLHKLYQKTFEKVSCPQELLDRQKTLMRDYDEINKFDSDDTDKTITAMKFPQKRGGINFMVISFAAASIILLLVSSVVFWFMIGATGGELDFIPLPPNTAPERNPGIVYPNKEDIDQKRFAELTGSSLPDKLSENFQKQTQSATAYYDSDDVLQLITCTAVYQNSSNSTQIITFTVSTQMPALLLGMSEESNEKISETPISLAAIKSKKIYYAFWQDGNIYNFMKFEGITQSGTEELLISILSS